ncbi:MAG: OmpA family protein [Gammaproteobacteria bacterium]
MKNEIGISRLVAPIAACLLMANTAIAHESGKANNSYVGQSGGHYITDGSGNCVRTGSYNKADMTVDCGAAPPPVKETKAPPPPPPPAPPPAMPVYETVTLSAGALFDFNKDVIKPEGKQHLDDVARKIDKTAQVTNVKIIGHTDSVGPAEYNQQLSVRRATQVRDYLASKGIASSLMTVSGMGETSPVADNSTRAGRAQNRRVDVSIGVKQQKR